MRMRLRTLGLAAAAVMPVVAVIALAPRQTGSASAAQAPAIEPSEHERTIEALRPPRRERPVIAIVALNDSTEITDLLVPYGVLSRANVADVTVVAERETPVSLHPFSRLGHGPELLQIVPQSTADRFDVRYPEGADYVVVPAMEPRDDPFVTSWVAGQHRKGATIVSVCAGSLTIAAAGLLDGRRATTHWAYLQDLQDAHPTMQGVPDRRYVVDRGISTSTGITATVPVTVALVEAIAGRPTAERLAQELGIVHWDARHRSSAFVLTWEHRKTFLRNWLALWRHTTIGVPVDEGVDEVALALTADARSRTALNTVVTVGPSADPVRSRHGLVIHPNRSAADADVDQMLPPVRSGSSGLTVERELENIASQFGRPTAEIVALVLEYPWSPQRMPTRR